MQSTLITSRQNDQIKFVRRLNQKKYRDQEGQFYLEGIRLVEEALKTGLVSRLFFSQSLLTTTRGKDILQQGEQLNIPLFQCSDEVFSEISDTVNSQGIIAVATKPTWDLKRGGVLVIADEIQDPGNMGTLLRTSAGAGVEGVLHVEGSVDLYNPKVLRASMGAIFSVPHWSLSREAVLELVEQASLKLVIADLVEAQNYWNVNYPPNLALVIGNEARGVHTSFQNRADLRVKIPLIGSIESLNASVAAGILLYEILRQRSDH